ncbi:aminotransferase class V-fold PLP-dependent enzyme [Clostridium amazonitimonense]|uniref:aminotransferase class V-fold PLP-dependent enzyme n=1 Tax=Clostridium amazonitimonense TaxID=1499689 RepID=UPI000509535F|nr:aminotransferase class V-fold PLP-dependent enzyme [Clostridium amazonitimonense]
MFIDYRELFSEIDHYITLDNGKTVKTINLDNAATTPPFRYVMDNIRYFSSYYGSIHRGVGYKSSICSNFYEEARKVILNYFTAPEDKYTVIFVKNTTEGLNKLSNRLISSKDQIVLTSHMEHHSNDLPWRGKCNLDYIGIDKDGRLSLESLYDKLHYYNGKVKLVTITGASNVTGFINDIDTISEICHKYGAELVVDGAQLVPHNKVKVWKDDGKRAIDYLVFSAHKMYAPFGVGVIIGKKDGFDERDPDCTGGGTVKVVTDKEVIWDEIPFKEEAGTPNFMGVVALLSSLRVLERLDMENIEKRERKLTEYLLNKLNQREYIEIYGSSKMDKDRLGIVSFNIKGIYHEKAAEILSKDYGIEVRSGCFCAHPYVQKLLNLSMEEIEHYKNNTNSMKPGMIRISFGIYNTEEEIDKLVEALDYINYSFQKQ